MALQVNTYHRRPAEEFPIEGKFHVRELLMQSDTQVQALPVRHMVVFDDGEEMVSTRNGTVYSHLFWQLFKPYPNTQILKQHHVLTVLKGKSLDAGTHAKLCSAIFKSIVVEEGLALPVQKEPLLAAIYRTISNAMTKLSFLSADRVTSLDILDFIQAARHPEIDRLRQESFESPSKIKYVNEKAMELIKTSPEFYHNGLAKASRAGLAKDLQVVQCVVQRGLPSEVDGAIFDRPIWSCYTLGNTALYDFVSDSRTAAKSHYYADTALKDSEYMARKFQLFTGTVEHIVHQDCGSQKLRPWIVGGEEKDQEGTVIYPGDLGFLVGKYYSLEGHPGLMCIEGDEKHLIGKTIYIRTVLTCQAENPHTVCHVCAGKLSENISRFTNIGHLGAVSTTKDLTQNILSIKHVNTSAVMVKILLDDNERNFMHTGPEGVAFYLNMSLKALKPQLVVARDEAKGLIDLRSMSNVDQISLSRISETTLVRLNTHDGHRAFSAVLDVKQRNKPSMMTRELLRYIKEKGWTTDDSNNFVFDMSEWDFTKPILKMPNKEESFVDLATAVDNLVRANLKMLNKRVISDAPFILLQELFELVNSKLRINILSFEIIVYALMVESMQSYAMARNAEDPVLGVADLLTTHRSLGNALAYESMSKTLTDPFSFFQGKRPDSPMDVFLAPKEVMAEYQGREFS